jgi:hypothetical protein
MTGEIRAVEECIVQLFDHLGIERAHIAAGRLVRGDWHGLAMKAPRPDHITDADLSNHA